MATSSLNKKNPGNLHLGCNLNVPECRKRERGEEPWGSRWREGDRDEQ